jgi:hypothetical protein
MGMLLKPSRPFLITSICLLGGFLTYLILHRLFSDLGHAEDSVGQGIVSMTQQAARFHDLDTSVAARLPVMFEGRRIATVRAQMAVGPLLVADSNLGARVSRADAAVEAMLGPHAGAIASAISAAWEVRPTGTTPTGLAALLFDSGPSRLYAGQYTVTPSPDLAGVVAQIDSQKHEIHLRRGYAQGRLKGQLWLGQPVVTIPVVDR